MVLDTLDGLIARLTNSSTAFGVQLDSLADVVSFGLAPGDPGVHVGPVAASTARVGGRLHLRHSRGHAPRALQHPDDHRHRQAAFRRPAEPRRRRRDRLDRLSVTRTDCRSRARRCRRWRWSSSRRVLMVSTIRFRSVKAIDMGWRRSYLALFLAAVALALIASHPRLALVIMSYSYVAFACLMWGLTKLGKRHGGEEARLEEVPDDTWSRRENPFSQGGGRPVDRVLETHGLPYRSLAQLQRSDPASRDPSARPPIVPQLQCREFRERT